jgi:hypothetical protein
MLVDLFVHKISFGVLLEWLTVKELVRFESSLAANLNHLGAFRRWIKADCFTLSQSHHGTIADIFELEWVLSRRVAVEALSLWAVDDNLEFNPYIVQCGGRLKSLDLHTSLHTGREELWGRGDFEHLFHHCPHLTSIKGIDHDQHGDLILTQLSQLKHISIKSIATQVFISSLFEVNNLVSLEMIVKEDVKPLMTAIVCSCDRLLHLRATLKCTPNIELHDDLFIALGNNCTQLQTLCILTSSYLWLNVTADGLAALALGCPDLRELELPNGCRDLEERGLITLAHTCTQLRVLCLHSCKRLSLSTVLHFAHCPKLSKIIIRSYVFRLDVEIKPTLEVLFAACPLLKYLSLPGIRAPVHTGKSLPPW